MNCFVIPSNIKIPSLFKNSSCWVLEFYWLFNHHHRTFFSMEYPNNREGVTIISSIRRGGSEGLSQTLRWCAWTPCTLAIHGSFGHSLLLDGSFPPTPTCQLRGNPFRIEKPDQRPQILWPNLQHLSTRPHQKKLNRSSSPRLDES